MPAIVAAGDRSAAKTVCGDSKVYLELGGRPLVVHTVEALQSVPEISEIWVVGDPKRLEAALDTPALRARLVKPLTIVPQFRNLYENAWETWRRTLPGAGATGRDPGPDDVQRFALFLSADLPFATPQEISAFVREGAARDCDYALGLTPDDAMRAFYPAAPGEPGIRMAYFNIREGRFRQNNLHLVRPALLGHRHYIEEMYELRHQRQLGKIAGLAWRILRRDGGGMNALAHYALIHVAGIADRRGWRGIADWLRAALPVERVERVVGRLLGTRFRFVVTEAGGCAVDIDNDEDFEAARARFESWRRVQDERAAALYGPPALPARAGSASPAALRVLGEEGS